MPDSDVINQSVTRDDYAVTPQAGVFFLAVSNWPAIVAMPPDLLGTNFADTNILLASTLDREALWAGALSIAVTKVTSLSWEITGDIPLRNRRAQDLFLNADAGRGWESFIAKLLQDFLTTDNGCFIEVVRSAANENAPIIGLIPLDSLRCRRTGNADEPVQYQDLKGAWHTLKWFEIIEFSDMPSPRASLFGSGKCAAHRAYPTIYEMASIQTYVNDKVSGRRPLSLNLINGLNDPQLRSVLTTAEANADQRGAIAYMGAIIATMPGDSQPAVATIPLAGLPENFDRKVEMDAVLLSYANNLGLDVQDLQPLTGQALGSGAQSQVLADKAKGKGLASFKQQFIHAMNQWVLPDLTTIAFVEKDWRDRKLQADANSAIVTYVDTCVKDAILTADQGLKILVDENVFDKDLLPEEQLVDDTLADSEKPDTGDTPPLPELPAPAAPVPAVPAVPVPPIPTTAKEVQRIIRDLRREARNA